MNTVDGWNGILMLVFMIRLDGPGDWKSGVMGTADFQLSPITFLDVDSQQS